MAMQIFDILAFETYLSYIHTVQALDNYNNCIKIESNNEELIKNSPIDMSLYSNNSFFSNGDFFMEKIGNLKIDDDEMLLYRYFCNGAKVKIQEKLRKDKREGSSYYDGLIYINKKSGDIYKATMNEHYYATQYSYGSEKDDCKKVQINIIRNVLLEAIE